MWFRFFTLKYIEINGHGFHISNFIGIKKSSQFFKQWPGRGTRLGTQWGPSLLAKMHEYGKKNLQNMMAHIWWIQWKVWTIMALKILCHRIPVVLSLCLPL